MDTGGDGDLDKCTVFIDGVILPRSVLPLHDRVLVHFTQDSTIWAYFDDRTASPTGAKWCGKARRTTETLSISRAACCGT